MRSKASPRLVRFLNYEQCEGPAHLVHAHMHGSNATQPAEHEKKCHSENECAGEATPTDGHGVVVPRYNLAAVSKFYQDALADTPCALVSATPQRCTMNCSRSEANSIINPVSEMGRSALIDHVDLQVSTTRDASRTQFTGTTITSLRCWQALAWIVELLNATRSYRGKLWGRKGRSRHRQWCRMPRMGRLW